jgi:hypothetical protein
MESATNVIYVGGLNRRVFWFIGKFNKNRPTNIMRRSVF